MYDFILLSYFSVYLQQRSITNVNIQQQQFQVGSMLRFAQGPVRPTNLEQYEELLQRQQSTASEHFPNRADILNQCRLAINQQLQRQQAVAEQKAAAGLSTPAENVSNEQEIPDNVTAELEKLEEESGTMVELHGVSDILGGLGDDDDDILGIHTDIHQQKRSQRL